MRLLDLSRSVDRDRLRVYTYRNYVNILPINMHIYYYIIYMHIIYAYRKIYIMINSRLKIIIRNDDERPRDQI